MLLIRSLPVALLLSLLLVTTGAQAAGSAESLLKREQAQLTALVRKAPSETRDEALVAVFERLLDYETLARQSLGRHWEGLSPEQRIEFTEVLKGLVQRAYERNVKKTIDYSVSYTGQSAADSAVLVRTVATSKKNARKQPVSIDYLMHQVDGRWRVRDIVTEGSSMVRSYRSQFSRIIAKKGFSELLTRMKRKLRKG